ncbi:MAG: gliding motility-associated C-terminal domain-containing protein [Bacteroidota bacterium]
MEIRTLTLVLLCFSGYHILRSQCGITVDAGVDFSVCAPGAQVQLNGLVSGSGISGFDWTPAAGLSNPNSLNPTVVVTNTTTFTLTAQTADPNGNLILNSGFEAGLADFTSDYVQGTGGSFGLLSNEGEFTVANNSNLTHNNFANCTPPGGSGQMLVVNGATTANESVWCQTVNVAPGTDYEISAFVATVVAENPALLQFSINGVLLGGPFNASSSLCNWQQFSEVWSSGGNTTADICILNQNTQGSGNDFALDDIFFSPVCQQSDQVTVTVVPNLAFVVDPDNLSCAAGATVFLDGSFSISGMGYTFQWVTSDGNIVSGANTPIAEIDEIGSYTLRVTYQDATVTCADEVTVTVTGDLPPNAVVDAPEVLGCTNTSVQINGNGSSLGGNISYQWTTSDGNIVSGANSLTPMVDAPGTYELLVTNTANGCTDIASVIVTEDTSPPNANPIVPGELNCQDTQIELLGLGSTQGPAISYAWSTLDGNINSGQNSINATVDQQGTYQLIVTNTSTGCADTASVQVNQNRVDPIAEALEGAPLDCLNGTTTLSAGNSSSGPGFSYSWTTANGSIISGEDSFSPTIGSAGTYELLVTNTNNNCTATASVTVAADQGQPTVSILSPAPISCANPTQLIDASNSSTGPEFVYSWTTTDGSIVNGSDSLIVEVGAAGTYDLQITNTDNSCVSSQEINIGIDTLSPLAEAGDPIQVDCGGAQGILSGLGSSTVGNFTYLWTTPDGNILTGADSLFPLVNTGGNYFLQVTNNDNGCTATDSVAVAQDGNIPLVQITIPDTLDCLLSSLQLDASSSSSGTDFELSWTTPNGSFGAGTDGLQPTVLSPGTYVLTIRDTTNNCEQTDSVLVLIDTLPPLAIAGADTTLTCDQPTIQLDPSGSNIGSGFSLSWTTMDGVLPPNPGDTPTIESPGTYLLTVTNLANNCQAIDQLTISLDTLSPQVDAGMDQTLNCRDSSFVIGGSGTDTGPEFSFVWTSAGGSFLSPTDGPLTTVDGTATYQLEVTNNLNGCSATDEVFIDLDRDIPFAEAGFPEELTCKTPVVAINSSASDGDEFVYFWSTPDGNLINNPSMLIAVSDAPGTYFLQVTDTINHCVALDSVVISQDTAAPIADAGPAFTLDCSLPQGELGSGNSSTFQNIEYLWTTVGGNFLSNVDSLFVQINAGGTYHLLVTDIINGCVAMDSVVIPSDSLLPTADPGLPFTLNCRDSIAVIGGGMTTVGPDISYSWTTTDGNILSTADSLEAEVDAAGTYQLEVTNTANSCSTVSSVTIEQDITPPSLDAGPGAELNCMLLNFNLSPTADQGSELDYLWTTPNGNLLGPATTLANAVDAPGTYYLLVANNDNFCSNLDSVIITQDTISPIADAGGSNTLTCTQMSLDLDGLNSSMGAVFNYQWTTPNGNILTGANGLTPSVDAPGTYRLLVTNTNNGCSANSSVFIPQDTMAPIVTLGPAEVLNCIITTTQLDASGSSSGADFVTDWSTADGNFVTGTDGLVPEIDAPGTYQLSIRDSSNGCEGSRSIRVEENVTPPAIEAGSGLTQNCVTGPIRLDATASGGGVLTISWSSTSGQLIEDVNTLSPLISGPGIYRLTVIDESNGCQAVDELELIQNLLLDFDFNVIDPTCRLPTATLEFTDIDGGVSPFLYSIDEGENYQATPLFSGLEPGSYDLQVQDINGCELTKTIGINSFEPLIIRLPDLIEIELGDDFTIFPQLNIPFDEIAELEWSPAAGLSCTDCLTPVAMPTESGRYRLEITSIDGCNADGIISVFVDRSRPIYFPTAFSPNGDGGNDRFFPFARRSAVQQINSFQIFNRWGDSVFENYDFQPNDPSNGWDGTERGQPLNPAVFVYVAEIEFIDGVKEVFKGEVILVR